MSQGCVLVFEASEDRLCVVVIGDIARGVGTGTGLRVCAMVITEGVTELVDSAAT